LQAVPPREHFTQAPPPQERLATITADTYALDGEEDCQPFDYFELLARTHFDGLCADVSALLLRDDFSFHTSYYRMSRQLGRLRPFDDKVSVFGAGLSSAQ